MSLLVAPRWTYLPASPEHASVRARTTAIRSWRVSFSRSITRPTRTCFVVVLSRLCTRNEESAGKGEILGRLGAARDGEEAPGHPQLPPRAHRRDPRPRGRAHRVREHEDRPRLSREKSRPLDPRNRRDPLWRLHVQGPHQHGWAPHDCRWCPHRRRSRKRRARRGPRHPRGRPRHHHGRGALLSVTGPRSEGSGHQRLGGRCRAAIPPRAERTASTAFNPVGAIVDSTETRTPLCNREATIHASHVTTSRGPLRSPRG